MGSGRSWLQWVFSGMMSFLSEAKYKPQDREDVPNPETYLQPIVNVISVEEMRVLCEETYKLYPQLNFYWSLDAWAVESPRFKYNGEIQDETNGPV